jgi:hypothetical protein
VKFVLPLTLENLISPISIDSLRNPYGTHRTTIHYSAEFRETATVRVSVIADIRSYRDYQRHVRLLATRSKYPSVVTGTYHIRLFCASYLKGVWFREVVDFGFFHSAHRGWVCDERRRGTAFCGVSPVSSFQLMQDEKTLVIIPRRISTETSDGGE